MPVTGLNFVALLCTTILLTRIRSLGASEALHYTSDALNIVFQDCTANTATVRAHAWHTPLSCAHLEQSRGTAAAVDSIPAPAPLASSVLPTGSWSIDDSTPGTDFGSGLEG